MTIWIHSTVPRNCLQASKPFIPFTIFAPPQKKDSHRLAPIFAVLSILGFIDDGRFQNFDHVPDVCGEDATVTAGGRVQDCAN